MFDHAINIPYLGGVVKSLDILLALGEFRSGNGLIGSTVYEEITTMMAMMITMIMIMIMII